MKRPVTGWVVIIGLILIPALCFILYAQFVLDYSLEDIKETLKTPQEDRGLRSYFKERLENTQEVQSRGGAGDLILMEAEKMEKAWKLAEAEQYYQEFLNRFPERPERGIVRTSLAHVLMKRGRLDEAAEILEETQREYAGMQEEATATNLLTRIAGIKRKLEHIRELEDWIKSQPDRIFSEEGGLELALGYLATYQIEKSLSLLGKLSEAPDPRLREKALYYRGWVHKWQGDWEDGIESFQGLSSEIPTDRK